MSQQADILFCQIAINNGLVRQEDAKKCLAYASKVEAQGKSRPRIGAVFVKANLLSQQQAQMVQQAVQKRLGGGGVAVGTSAGAPKMSRREAREQRRARARPRKAIDPSVMWLGIGSGVVLLAAVMFMVVMLINARRDDDKNQATADTSAATSTNLSTNAEFRDSLGVGGAGAAPQKQAVPEDSETRQRFERDHNGVLLHARSMRGDSVYSAYQYLEKYRENEKSRYELMSDLAAELDSFMAELAGEMDQVVNDAIAEAEGADKAEARRILEAAKDQVDAARKAKLDEKLKAILEG